MRSPMARLARHDEIGFPLTVSFVQFLYLEGKAAFQHYVVVKLVPFAKGGKLWTREYSERREIQTVYCQCHEIRQPSHEQTCNHVTGQEPEDLLGNSHGTGSQARERKGIGGHGIELICSDRRLLFYKDGRWKTPVYLDFDMPQELLYRLPSSSATDQRT